MANLDTTAEILKKVLQKVGELSDGTSKYRSQALEEINDIYQKIVGGSNEFNLDVGEPWIWARGQSPLILTLTPGIQGGTVNMTLGSKAGTFSQIPVNYLNAQISLAGWWILVDNESEWYRIAAHTAGQTSFTLDSQFNFPSGSTYSYQACLIDYTLTVPETGGICRLAGPMIVQQDQTIDGDFQGKIYESDYNQMRQFWPMNVIEIGTPTRFAVTSYADGIMNVRFNKYLDSSYEPVRVESDYVPVPSDLTDEPDTKPILPRRWRNALVYGPAAVIAKDNHDDIAEAYDAKFTKILEAMKRDDQRVRDKASKQRGWLVPRADQITAAKARKLYNI